MPTTTLNDAREAVYERWRVEWASTTPYSFHGEHPPEHSSGSRAVVRFNGDDASTQTLGAETARKFTRYGRILVWIYTELGGLRTGDLLAKQALDIFESRRFSGVWTHPGEIKATVGERWIEHLIDIPCAYEEDK